MERQSRYLVVKKRDMRKALTGPEMDKMFALAGKVDIWREEQGKHLMSAVVVEKDWPEYEPVWKMIEARVDGKPCEPRPTPPPVTYKGPTHPEALELGEAYHKNSSGDVAVSDSYRYSKDMKACPRGAKVILLGAGGVATLGAYDGDPFWVGWAALPKDE